MDFHEDAVNAGRNSGTRQHRYKFRLATTRRGTVSSPFCSGWQLHGVRCIEHDRSKLAHDGERSHIHDQIGVAEAGAPFSNEDLLVASLAAFFHGMSHVPRRHELALLEIDCSTAERGSDYQIGLAAEKRGNLENIDDFGHLGHVGGFVHVGENWNAQLIFDFFQYSQAFFNAGTAKAANRSAIGFVIAGFEDEWEFERASHPLDNFRHADSVLFTFDDARAGNEKQTAAADADIVDLEFCFQPSVLGSKVSVKSVQPTSAAKFAGDGSWSETISPPVFLGVLGDLGGELSSSYFFRPMEHLDGCRFFFSLSLLAVFIGRANKCPE